MLFLGHGFVGEINPNAPTLAQYVVASAIAIGMPLVVVASLLRPRFFLLAVLGWYPYQLSFFTLEPALNGATLGLVHHLLTLLLIPMYFYYSGAILVENENPDVGSRSTLEGLIVTSRLMPLCLLITIIEERLTVALLPSLWAIPHALVMVASAVAFIAEARKMLHSFRDVDGKATYITRD